MEHFGDLVAHAHEWIHRGQGFLEGLADGAAAQHIRRPALEGHGTRGRIGNHEQVDFVEVGKPRLEIVRVLHQVDVGATLPFLEHERPHVERSAGRRGWLWAKTRVELVNDRAAAISDIPKGLLAMLMSSSRNGVWV